MSPQQFVTLLENGPDISVAAEQLQNKKAVQYHCHIGKNRWVRVHNDCKDIQLYSYVHVSGHAPVQKNENVARGKL